MNLELKTHQLKNLILSSQHYHVILKKKLMILFNSLTLFLFLQLVYLVFNQQ